MNRVRVNKADRILRKLRIRQSIQTSEKILSDHFKTLYTEHPEKKMSRKRDNKFRNRKSIADFAVGECSSDDDRSPLIKQEANETKGSKIVYDMSPQEDEIAPLITQESNETKESKIVYDVSPQEDEKSPLITQEANETKGSKAVYDMSPQDSSCTYVTILLDDDDGYMSDLTYDDEPIDTNVRFRMDDDCDMSEITCDDDFIIEKTQHPKKVTIERTPKEKRRPKPEPKWEQKPEKNPEDSTKEKTTKEKKRPKGERKLQDRDSKNSRIKKSTHTRSSDPSQKSLERRRSQRSRNQVSRKKGEKSTRKPKKHSSSRLISNGNTRSISTDSDHYDPLARSVHSLNRRRCSVERRIRIHPRRERT